MQITIRAARINKGLKQDEAAEQLGISKNTLLSYENGKSSPNIKIAKAMSMLYQVPLDNLIF